MQDSMAFYQGLLLPVSMRRAVTAGRPVVAAAVILDPSKPLPPCRLQKLSEGKREQLFTIIKESALSWAIAAASVAEIEELNILQATLLAMQRAVQGLHIGRSGAVDGNQLLSCLFPHRRLSKATAKCRRLALRHMAKVERTG